jgi:hypothetical protein
MWVEEEILILPLYMYLDSALSGMQKWFKQGNVQYWVQLSVSIAKELKQKQKEL